MGKAVLGGILSFFFSSETLWPVSNAVELATARIKASLAGLFGAISAALHMRVCPSFQWIHFSVNALLNRLSEIKNNEHRRPD
jgi:hypothetical protein